jgi:hypothetical protein
MATDIHVPYQSPESGCPLCGMGGVRFCEEQPDGSVRLLCLRCVTIYLIAAPSERRRDEQAQNPTPPEAWDGIPF